jgi:hypothetical protein
MAEEWLAATSKSERDRIFKRTGVRWSELLRLPYWDPTRSIVVDGMHNLFLNLVKYHIEEVVGLREEVKAVFPPATTEEMVEARKVWTKGVNRESQLKKVKMPALLGLCAENEITLPETEGRRIKRSVLIAAMIVCLQSCFGILLKFLLQRNSQTSDDEPNERTEDTTVPIDALPGNTDEDIAAASEADINISCYKVLGKCELEQIQQDISNTVRPRWQSGPPTNLGTKGCGKLKADQLRTSMEFDIPVSLVKLWSGIKSDGSNGVDEMINRRRLKILESTMLLATALQWATSYQTSEMHSEGYMKDIRAYLANLRILFPSTDLRTCHHTALFIGEMLLRFGPIHGWWMFPFERVIGLLQQFNTNSKMGG